MGLPFPVDIVGEIQPIIDVSDLPGGSRSAPRQTVEPENAVPKSSQIGTKDKLQAVQPPGPLGISSELIQDKSPQDLLYLLVKFQV